MKSYFAKLADRATLPNVPATSTGYAPKLSDPFEETNQTPSTAQIKPQTPALKDASTTFDSRALTADSMRTESDASVPRFAKTEPEVTSTESRKKGTERAAILTERLEPDDHRELTPAPIKPVSPTTVLLPTEPPPTLSPATQQPGEPKESPSDERVYLAARESELLRQADAFMAHVLASDSQMSETRDVDVVKETTITKLVEDSSRNLNPVSPSQRPLINEPEGPSLVIGKLTVEVTPSKPQSENTTQRIVVRGRGLRGRGLPTSRRFGLGQF